jgi:hypothetical protein
VEVDGEAHGRGDRPERDAERDAWLEAQGCGFCAFQQARYCRTWKRSCTTSSTPRAETTPPPASPVPLPLRGRNEEMSDPSRLREERCRAGAPMA